MSDGDETADKAGQTQGQVSLERMYLKDASFESPSSPGVFQESWKPDVELAVNTRSGHLDGGRYEVVLTVTVTAKLGDATAFIAEVQHAGLFVMQGLPEDVMRRAAGTFCPATLFPYVREAVDSLVVRGGFPPLHLAPINFDAAYEDALRQAQAAEGGAPTTH